MSSNSASSSNFASSSSSSSSFTSSAAAAAAATSTTAAAATTAAASTTATASASTKVGASVISRGKYSPWTEADSLSRLGYGSFHQRYFLDDTLIAVTVIDILPHCLSSVYAFFDPNLKGLELGKLTALFEIDWVQTASTLSHRLSFYYMGFFILQCPKMRYKAEFAPSDLLCPQTRIWVPLKPALALLEADKHATLAAMPKSAVDALLLKRVAKATSLIPSTPISIGDTQVVLISMLTRKGQLAIEKILMELLPLLDDGLSSRFFLAV